MYQQVLWNLKGLLLRPKKNSKAIALHGPIWIVQEEPKLESRTTYLRYRRRRISDWDNAPVGSCANCAAIFFFISLNLEDVEIVHYGWDVASLYQGI